MPDTAVNIDYNYDDGSSMSSDCSCQSGLLSSDYELIYIIIGCSVTIVVQGTRALSQQAPYVIIRSCYCLQICQGVS